MMTDSITNLQKRKIKEMIDELIISRGILKIDNKQINIDGINIEKLANEAFRYYRMVVKGESPLDIDLHAGRYAKQPDSLSSRSIANCIGCNQPLADDDISRHMPVCRDCRAKVRADYGFLQELFR
jgi:hypothetical protein